MKQILFFCLAVLGAVSCKSAKENLPLTGSELGCRKFER